MKLILQVNYNISDLQSSTALVDILVDIKVTNNERISADGNQISMSVYDASSSSEVSLGEVSQDLDITIAKDDFQVKLFM